MKKTILFKTMLLLCALIVGSSSAWAEESTLTYVFQNKSWGAKIGDTDANWTSGKDGGGFSNNGVQVTTSVSGANATSPVSFDNISKIVVTYNTNKTSGAGKFSVKIGDNDAVEKDWAYSSSADDGRTANYTLQYDYETPQSGYVTITAKTSTNSIYVVSIAITYGDSNPATATTVTIDGSGITNTNVYEGTAAGQLSATVKAGDDAIEGATVTWTSSDEDVATIDEDGVVTLVAAGTTTITASYAGVENEYKPSSETYVLTVTNNDPNAPGTLNNPFTVAQAIDFISAFDYDENTNYYVKGIISSITSTSVSGGYLTYNISDDGTTTNQLQVYKGKNLNNTDFTDVSDIEVDDNVIIVGPLFNYYNKSNSIYIPEINIGNYIYSTDHKNREDAGLIVEDDFEMEVTTTKPVKEVYVKDSDGEVTITSDNEAVIKVEDGLLKALSVGSAVITVSVAKTETYKAASAEFTVTVGARPGVDPEGAGAGDGYSLVTDASTLKNGDKILIVAQDDEDSYYALSTTQNTNNRGAKLVTVSGNVIKSISDEVQVITLEGETDAWYFNVDGKYLYAASNSNNHLKTEPEIDANNNAKAKITIDGGTGNASIIFQGTNSRNELRYNGVGTSHLFSCYASNSTMTVPQIYRMNAASSFDITVSAAGWRGLVTAVDATLPETLTAYTVTAYNESTATLTKVDAVKANTPYIVKGNEGTYTLAVAEDEVEAPVGNLLQISTQNTGNGVYVLYNGASGVGFYLWSGGSLGAGRVYLPATTNAREFIGLDSETTGISTVNSEAKSLFNGEFFNMAGQRVAKPAKGLYIVNGKKVVIK